MPLFTRRRPEEPEDVWGPEFSPRRVPVGPDPVELDRLLLRLDALVEIRASWSSEERARGIVRGIEQEIARALDSATKHRDWPAARARVLELMTALGQVLYEPQPEAEEGGEQG